LELVGEGVLDEVVEQHPVGLVRGGRIETSAPPFIMVCSSAKEYGRPSKSRICQLALAPSSSVLEHRGRT
jgi:hypothetical protein